MRHETGLAYAVIADVTRAAMPDGSGSTTTQVYRAAFYEWATVIDPNDDGATSTRIRDSNSRPERQRSVGSSHRARIELLAGCRSSSCELLTIVSGKLGLGSTLQANKRT